jgi:NAD(P)-dependent dehydrogenase (short-subunit alcohol dehydrogenase family)
MILVEMHQTAIVTGAGQGMGEAFAKILALNGATVVV